jgi:hypothetical protein
MRKDKRSSSDKKENNNETKKGLYVNDYSPKFSESYNVYDKAREHMKKLRKEQLEKNDSNKSDTD